MKKIKGGFIGTGGVAGLKQELGEKGRFPGERRLIPVADDSVGNRMLARIQGGEGGLRGDPRAEKLIDDDALFGQGVEIRAGGERVAVATQMIGSEGVDHNQQNVRSLSHASPTHQPTAARAHGKQAPFFFERCSVFSVTLVVPDVEERSKSEHAPHAARYELIAH